jgi:hypothetical protein
VKAGGQHSLKMEGHVPPKRRLTLNGIHGIISQKDRTLLKKRGLLHNGHHLKENVLSDRTVQ